MMKKFLQILILLTLIISNSLYPKGDKKDTGKLQKVTAQKTYTFSDINRISTYFYNNGKSVFL